MNIQKPEEMTGNSLIIKWNLSSGGVCNSIWRLVELIQKL
jgi:hypothetical protein